MNVSALKAAGYEWIMHEMIRLNKKIDRLTAENEDLKKALKADSERIGKIIKLEKELKAAKAEADMLRAENEHE